MKLDKEVEFARLFNRSGEKIEEQFKQQQLLDELAEHGVDLDELDNAMQIKNNSYDEQKIQDTMSAMSRELDKVKRRRSSRRESTKRRRLTEVLD